jgi:hypothetical protein
MTTTPRRACLALLLAAACSGEVDPIPDGGVVTCSSTSDCPSGHTCSPALGRCIRSSNEDRQPPGIVAGSASALPAAARAGALVTVSFEADEDLASDPVVRFSGVATPLGAPHRDGRTYTVAFPASEGDGEGAHAIVARLVDLAGNVTESAPVAAVTFDFTPPSATAPAVTPAFARAGGALTVTATFSEPLDGAPSLAIAAGPALSAAAGPGPNEWTFTRTLDGSEPPGLADLLLSARDAAGNELVRRYTAAASLDFAAPAVEGAAIRTASLRAGDTFVAEVRFDEPLAAPPALTLVPTAGGPALAVTASALDVRTFALSAAVPAGAADGERELRLVSALDRAGNPAAPVTLGTCLLDSTAPALQALAPDHASRLYRAGSPVAVTFSLSEDAAAPPDVRLETLPLPLAMPCLEAPARSFTCTSAALAGTELPESVVNVAVSVRDAAGNVSVGGTSVVLDFTGPRVLSAVPGRAAFPENGTIAYAVDVSERLAFAPALAVSTAGAVVPGFFGAPASASATSFTWSRPVPTGADGDYSVAVTVVDEAGNPGGPYAGAPFGVDTVAPSVVGASTLSPAKAAYREGDVPALTLTVSEDLPGVPVARLSTATPVDAPCTLSTPPRTYTCTLERALTAGDLPEGANALLVTLADAASNVGYHSKAVTLDHTPPTHASVTPQLLATEWNLLSTVGALGDGGVFRLSIIAAEPLAWAPQVVARDPVNGHQATLSLVSETGTSYVYELKTNGVEYPAGTWWITWDPVDLAGNRWPALALPQIATVEVDSTPPPEPQVGAADAPLVTWRRVPWGSDVAAEPRYRVNGDAASVSDADLVVGWDGPGVDAIEVGRAAVDASGFLIQLSSDPLDLWISALDAAGNQSARTRVVDVVWIASLGGKVPGSRIENPHRLETRSFDAGALQQVDAIEIGEAQIGLAGDLSKATTTGGATFRRIGGRVAPQHRAGYSMAYDAARGRVVVFGGWYTNPFAPASDVWEWDGSGWREIVPMDPEGDGNPPLFHRSPLLFDPLQGGVVLCSRGLWLWTGTSWRQLDREVARPPAPNWNHAAAAWDAGRGVLVLFGGDSAARETWEWNGSSWRDATPALSSDSPPASTRHGMAYDTVRGRVLSFGGNLTSDLWAWDGTRWEVLAVAGTPPPARSSHSVTWDDEHDELVVHGGWLGIDLNVWDGHTYVLRTDAGVPTWHEVTPATGPISRAYEGAAWDPGGKRVLLVRFPSALGFEPGEVRFWTGSTSKEWRLLDVADPEQDGDPSYPGREWSGLAFNRTRNVAVFHKGSIPPETWEWNRVSWARKADESMTNPGVRFGFSMASYGPDVILFGGEQAAVTQGDTWRWSGALGWQQVIPSPDPLTAPPDAFRMSAGMVEDPVSGRLFRFGGCSAVAGYTCFADLWEWTGSDWTRLGGAPWDDLELDGSPQDGDAAGADESGVVWDRSRGSLLFAQSMVHHYWEWKRDTTNWIFHPIPPAPGPDTVRFFFYDDKLEAPVLVADNGVWQLDLDANAYLPVPLGNVDGISRPSAGRIAVDEASGRGVLVANPPVTWDGGYLARPAHVLHVDYSRANGPDPAVCAGGAACPIKRIEVRWTGGGSGPWGDGAFLRAWTGEWSTTVGTSSAASANAPQTFVLSWDAAGSPIPGASLFHGAARELSVVLLPSSFNTQAGPAVVATDAVEAAIWYRRE